VLRLMTLEIDPTPRKGLSRRTLVTGAALTAAAGLAAVYGIGGFARNPSGPAVCTDARATVKRIAPLARGELAALTIASDPRPLPALAFSAPDGTKRALADFHGRTVLLNLWATWCVPCRKEMPALNALEEKLGGDKFEVVAVNIDTRDPEKPKAWLKENGITRLGYYADPSAKIFQDLKAVGKAFGMPTTVLIDPAGCELASLAGPAEWASEDALKLVRGALGN
jgi:thiol-disulfide isomerase/thioredoxin